MICITCGQNEVAEEYTRCSACNAEHKKLAEKLDSKHSPIVKIPKEVLIPFKSMRQGIEVTTYYSKEDCFNMGIPIPKEYENTP